MTPWTPDAIKQLRTRLGLTQAQLAGRLGCALSTVTMWEQGHRSPDSLRSDALDALDQPLPPRLSASLSTTAMAFDEDAAAAIRDGQPESAERLQRIAGHLRRLAYTHRAAAEYQGDPSLDPPQITIED